MKLFTISLSMTLLFIICACKVTSHFKPGLETPPGSVLIADELYCDVSEMTNFTWLEYMFWTQRIYGKNSPEHVATLPDTNVWQVYTPCATAYTDYYLGHPAYRNYPVVGISQAQAKAYSQWRSDRVFEYMLIREGVLQLDTAQTPETYFTIERYIAENKKNGRTPALGYYPQFRLPTLEERATMLAYADSVNGNYIRNSKGKKLADCRENYPYINTDTSPCTHPDPVWYVTSGGCVAKNGGIYHLQGNAAEWLNEENVIAGGSWTHERAAVLAQDTVHLNHPTAWSGFRNVCEWVPIEP